MPHIDSSALEAVIPMVGGVAGVVRVTYQTQDQAEVVRIVIAPNDCGFQ